MRRDPDIFFLSYDEPNADQNWRSLSSRFPRARHVHGIRGIWEAHAECARLSESELFYLVDADNCVDPNFSFSYRPPDAEKNFVHVWRCRNAVNDLVYGFGAIKLYPRSAFLNRRAPERADIATHTGLVYKIVPELASVTHFNSDAYRSWRAGFRECAKLASGLMAKNEPQRLHAESRLETWCRQGNEREFGRACIAGARAGRAYAARNLENPKAMLKINDFDWLYQEFEATHA